MATSEDTHETQDVPTDFNFDEWAASLNLSRKITQVLRQEELTSKEALSLIELKDLKELNFPMGTTKVIMRDINKWKIVNVDAEHNVQTSQTGNMGQLEGSGKSLDSLLNEFQAPPAEAYKFTPYGMGSHRPQNYSNHEGTVVKSCAYNFIYHRTMQAPATEHA